MRFEEGSLLDRLWLVQKALVELGPGSLYSFFLYQLGLRSGYYRLASVTKKVASLQAIFLKQPNVILSTQLCKLPTRENLLSVLGDEGLASLITEADGILAGKVRLFGAAPVPLVLKAPGALKHWTFYASHSSGTDLTIDIKDIWEPARFGWAFVLARAYQCTGDQRYAACFWELSEAFLEENPAYYGPHWASAQEAALRIMALVFAWQVFHSSQHTTPRRSNRLAEAVAIHANRIPLTAVYARAQNNNHLLSEAAGLITAGLALPELPQAKVWFNCGWKWFIKGILSQIDGQGVYLQHSTNYHRLMLHLALWVNCLISPGKETPNAHSSSHQHHSASQLHTPPQSRFPPQVFKRLTAATRWLLSLCDLASGGVPNLGPNDGALILPLSPSRFDDYRPVLQAAGTAFMNRAPFPTGVWDEALLWLGIHEDNAVPAAVQTTTIKVSEQAVSEFPNSTIVATHTPNIQDNPHVIRAGDGQAWVYLRLARFTSRPGHADLLHLDLWWRGINLTQDAGTYRYNAPAPWDNVLAETEFHNTISINGCSQMRRAGRFLFLDRAEAYLVSRTAKAITAEQDGYRLFGLRHIRTVSLLPDQEWLVEDQLIRIRHSAPRHTEACLHWLLPDWDFTVERGGLAENRNVEYNVKVKSAYGWVNILLGSTAANQDPSRLQITRAGELVYGDGPHQTTWGWFSPTYGEKLPALSVRLLKSGEESMGYTTQFQFPG